MNIKKFLKMFAMPLAALLATMLTGAVILLLTGYNPITAYGSIFRSALGTKRGISQTLLQATPLLLCGLGVSIAFKGKIFNIGAEGQFFAGALFATVVAVSPVAEHMPAALLIAATCICGCLGGMAMGLIAAFLRIKANAPEVVTTVMLNSILILLISWLVNGGPLQESQGYYPTSNEIAQGAKLPYFWQGTRLHIGYIISLLFVFVVWFVIEKTDVGFRIKTMGANPLAAECAGININKTLPFAFAISGALSGLAGSIQLTGVTYMLYRGMSPGYGFTAIAVAQLGRLNPFGILISSTLFGALQSGANAIMRDMGIPASLGSMLMALALFFVLIFTVFEQIIDKKIIEKKQALMDGAGKTVEKGGK